VGGRTGPNQDYGVDVHRIWSLNLETADVTDVGWRVCYGRTGCRHGVISSGDDESDGEC
jgi:hypothetical protein